MGTEEYYSEAKAVHSRLLNGPPDPNLISPPVCTENSLSSRAPLELGSELVTSLSEIVEAVPHWPTPTPVTRLASRDSKPKRTPEPVRTHAPFLTRAPGV